MQNLPILWCALSAAASAVATACVCVRRLRATNETFLQAGRRLVIMGPRPTVPK